MTIDFISSALSFKRSSCCSPSKTKSPSSSVITTPVHPHDTNDLCWTSSASPPATAAATLTAPDDDDDRPTKRSVRLFKSGFSLFSRSYQKHSSSSTSSRRRSSSISHFFRAFCSNGRDLIDDPPLFQSRRSSYTSAFANDALFERYRYRKQSLSQTKLDLGRRTRSQSISSSASTSDSSTATNSSSLREDPSPPPRVVCWQNPQPLPSILVKRSTNHHHHHRHNASALSAPAGPEVASEQKRSYQHHIRHYSHVSYISSSNMTVNSEDLTAKEFADIAGIRIVPDEPISPSGEDIEMHQRQPSPAPLFLSHQQQCSSCIQPPLPQHRYHQRRHSTAVHSSSPSTSSSGPPSPDQYPHISHQYQRSIDTASGLSSGIGRQPNSSSSILLLGAAGNSSNTTTANHGCNTSSSLGGDEVQIWDDAFWRGPGTCRHQQPQQQQQQQQQVVDSRKRLSLASSKKKASLLPPLPPSIMSESVTPQKHKKHHSTSSSLSFSSEQPTQQGTTNRVIKKGRFEIHLETAC